MVGAPFLYPTMVGAPFPLGSWERERPLGRRGRPAVRAMYLARWDLFTERLGSPCSSLSEGCAGASSCLLLSAFEVFATVLKQGLPACVSCLLVSTFGRT